MIFLVAGLCGTVLSKKLSKMKGKKVNSSRQIVEMFTIKVWLSLNFKSNSVNCNQAGSKMEKFSLLAGNFNLNFLALMFVFCFLFVRSFVRLFVWALSPSNKVARKRWNLSAYRLQCQFLVYSYGTSHCLSTFLQMTFTIAASLGIGSAVWFYFITQSTKQMVYAPIVLIGCSSSAMYVMTLAFITDVIGQDKVCVR